MTNDFTSTKKFNAVRGVTGAIRKAKGKDYMPQEGVDYTLARDATGVYWVATVVGDVVATAETAVTLDARGQLTEGSHDAIAAVSHTVAEQVVARRAAKAAAGTSNQASPAVAPQQMEEPHTPPTLPRTGGKRAAATKAAAAGVLPTAPDFSANTHKAFRKRLEAVKAMVAAGDIAGLRADTTEPKSSSRAAICRYRDLAIVALAARAAQQQ